LLKSVELSNTEGKLLDAKEIISKSKIVPDLLSMLKEHIYIV